MGKLFTDPPLRLVEWAHWETDLVAKTETLDTGRHGSVRYPTFRAGRGHVGGAHDEYWSALHPDDRYLMQKFHELADSHQDSFTSEYRVVWPDGTTLWLRGHGRGLLLARRMGKLTASSASWPDVTERKAAEDHAKFLMQELSHRSKNLLAVIQSISRRTDSAPPRRWRSSSRFGRRLLLEVSPHHTMC